MQRSLKQAEQGTGLVMLIEYDSRLVGIVGCNWIEPMNRSCEIGYWLDQDHLGQGIMTNATRRLINYAFDDLSLNRVSIPVAVENRKSRAIPERLGFKIEGIIREAEWLYDHFVDHILYGLLRSDWPNRPNA